jgi:hypothetical protein
MLLSSTTSCLRQQMSTVARRGVIIAHRQTTIHAVQTPGQSPLSRMMHNRSLICGGSSMYAPARPSYVQQQIQIAPSRSMSQIAEEGAGTHKPSEFQKKILVWAKMYPSTNKVPERVTRVQLKVAMDKFRIRASIFMVAGTIVFAAIFALIGRREHAEGKTVTKMSIDRRQS